MKKSSVLRGSELRLQAPVMLINDFAGHKVEDIQHPKGSFSKVIVNILWRVDSLRYSPGPRAIESLSSGHRPSLISIRRTGEILRLCDFR
jgi:hypothetical protein